MLIINGFCSRKSMDIKILLFVLQAEDVTNIPQKFDENGVQVKIDRDVYASNNGIYDALLQ